MEQGCYCPPQKVVPIKYVLASQRWKTCILRGKQEGIATQHVIYFVKEIFQIHHPKLNGWFIFPHIDNCGCAFLFVCFLFAQFDAALTYYSSNPMFGWWQLKWTLVTPCDPTPLEMTGRENGWMDEVSPPSKQQTKYIYIYIMLVSFDSIY